MTYSPNLGSAFNDTYMRSNRISHLSGMCSFCTDECPGTCEIALAAVLGKRTVYPTNTGDNQVASEKNYPIDWSHFNINGRCFGYEGLRRENEDINDDLHVFNVNLQREYGKFNPVKMELPLILPALIKLNWKDYFGGAAMAGVSCVIGEDARTRDPNLVIENGEIVKFDMLAEMLDSFRKYDRGYGQIILQCNMEDDMLKLPEFAIREYNVDALEFKFGQSGKGVQPVIRLKDREEALETLANGIKVYPDPNSPEIIKKAEEGCCPNFYSYSRFPAFDEDYLIGRIEGLREMGIKNFYLKMTGYDISNLERVMRIGSDAKVDMITFDGAGGGSGYSPNRMMNEWAYPAILMEEAVCRIADQLEAEDKYIPAITMTGGFSSEDDVFKSLAMGEGRITAVGLCRAGMTAAMTGKNIGERIKDGDIPKNMERFGSIVDEIYGDLADLRAIYGKKANDFSLGAVGVFSYLNKIGYGIQHFAALNRKFDLDLLDKSDLIPLTRESKDLLEGNWF